MAHQMLCPLFPHAHTPCCILPCLLYTQSRAERQEVYILTFQFICKLLLHISPRENQSVYDSFPILPSTFSKRSCTSHLKVTASVDFHKHPDLGGTGPVTMNNV